MFQSGFTTESREYKQKEAVRLLHVQHQTLCMNMTWEHSLLLCTVYAAVSNVPHRRSTSPNTGFTYSGSHSVLSSYSDHFVGETGLDGTSCVLNKNFLLF